jgi:ribosomal protein S6--L-glutamate ligase
MKSFTEYISENFITNVDQLEKSFNMINEANKKNPYFFDNIIFFTNERNSKKNKTLKNLEDAIKDTGINLVVFVADEVQYKASDNEIKISDKKTEYTIDKQSNVDTICIVRLGAQKSEQCVECIKEIQNWGIYTLNPILAAKRASNKYTSAVLMERYGIPQPRYALLTRSDIENGMDSLVDKLELIYPDVKKADDKAEDYEYVCKILSGHGGSGVFLVTGKTILAVLQTIFTVDQNIELLLQRKEEADGGDIRVHVITGRTEQKIIAAMKRVKLSKDFRSNVSLGASAEAVELTPEQEEIAKNVAKVSGMPWCACDIMPLVKGSNPEIGDNVVLEYNASPGTDGISEVIGKNFVTVLLDSINDVNQLVLAPKSIGYKEQISIKLGDKFVDFEAKLDTGNGAKASTIGCDKIEVDGDDIIATINDKEYKFKKHGLSKAIVGPVTEERNTVIIKEIQLGKRKLKDVEFALVDNRNKSTKVLLNRDVLSKMAYLIDPAQKHSLNNN